MPRAYAALLRGINVGGRHRLAMATLREAVAGLGHTGVQTYIQSGNVVFRTGRGAQRSDARLAADLEAAISAAAGFDVPVLVRSRDELAAAVSANPFPRAEPKQLHYLFLETRPAAAVVAAVAALAEELPGADEARVDGLTLYLFCPDGIGRSTLADKIGRPLGTVRSTARNRATVEKLVALCDEVAAG